MRTPNETEDSYYADLESSQPASAGQAARQEWKPGQFDGRLVSESAEQTKGGMYAYYVSRY